MKRIWLFAPFTAIMLLSIVGGCRTVTFQVEPADNSAGFSLFAGDPDSIGITRAQVGERIACSEPRFGDYICLRATEFQVLVEEIRAARNARGEP